MFQILFFVKTLVLTFVLVFFLQIKIGEFTLEEKAHSFIQNSTLLEPLRETTDYAVTFLRLQGRRISGLFKHKIDKQWSASQIPGQRHLGLTLERSKTFLKEQVEKKKASESKAPVDSEFL